MLGRRFHCSLVVLLTFSLTAQPFLIWAQAPTAAPSSVPAFAFSSQNELGKVVARPFVDEQQQVVERRSGQLICTTVDMVVPAGAVHLEVIRSLQLAPTDEGLLGTRWRLNWERRVRVEARVAVLDDGIGSTIFYATDTSTYRALDGRKLDFGLQHAVCTNGDGSKDYFGPDGRLIAIDYRNGNKAVLRYVDGRLTRIDGPLGVFIRLQYDAHNRVARLDASNGAVVEYAYGADSSGAQDAADDGTLHYTYDAEGRLTRLKHPRAGTTSQTYDDLGRVTSRKFSDGTEEIFAFDNRTRVCEYRNAEGFVTATQQSPDGRAVAVRSPRGFVTKVQSDDAGRPALIEGPTGKRLQIGYDHLGRVASVSDSIRGATQLLYRGDSSQLAARVSPDGETQELRYDAEQNPTSVDLGPGRLDNAQVEYYPNGQVKSIVRGDGERVELTYDERGFLDSIADAAGATHRFEYDDLGNPVKQVDPRGGATKWTYDEHGRTTSVTDPLGATTQFEYDEKGQLVKTVDARGAVSAYGYDRRGRIVSETDPLGREIRWSYTAAGDVASVTLANGKSHKFKYDPDGNLIGIVNPLGGGEAMMYDATGNVTASVRSSGAQDQFEYSAAGHLVRTIDTTGGAHHYAYDASGRLVRDVDTAGQVTRYAFDERGQLGMIIPPAGEVIRLKYDGHGNLNELVEGEKTVARYEYDILGRRTREESSTGHVVQYEYDPEGRLVAWSDNLGAGATFEFDAVGRPTVARGKSGAKLVRRYDAAGNVVQDVDAMGGATKYEYNLANELTAVRTPNGARAAIKYDRAGRPVTFHHPDGGASQVAYDELGHAIARTDPLGKRFTRKFDASGSLVEMTDAKGQTTRYEYDSADRIVQMLLADGTKIEYAYDEQSNLASVDDGKFPIRYAYDARGNRVRVEYPAIQQWIAYRYDDQDRLLEYTSAAGSAVRYAYDEFDRIASIEAEGIGRFRFEYDAAGRLISRTHPNGVRSIVNYDSEDRIVGLAHLDSEQKALAGWAYEYDLRGDCVRAVDAKGETTSYAYDAGGQLVEESHPAQPPVRYEYTAGGNRTLRSDAAGETRYRHDPADQMIEAGDASLRYDANGNLLERRGAQGVTRYEYDVQDRLVRVHLPDGSNIAYGYAPTGERIWRKDAQGTTHFLPFGVHVLAELDETFQPNKTFVYGQRIDQPLAVAAGDRVHFLHADRRGSIRSVTDAEGTSSATYRFDAFGRLVAREGAADPPFRFVGKSYDPATGLYFFRTRYYDPGLGRFLSRDPVTPEPEDPITLNPYQFARNNPVTFSDPFGRWASPTEMIPYRYPIDVSRIIVESQDAVIPGRTLFGRYRGVEDMIYIFPTSVEEGTGVLTAIHETDHRRRVNQYLNKWARDANKPYAQVGVSPLPFDPDQLSYDQRKLLLRGKLRDANMNHTALGRRLERKAYMKQAKFRFVEQGIGPGDKHFNRYLTSFEQYGGDRDTLMRNLKSLRERRLAQVEHHRLLQYRKWKQSRSFGKYAPPRFGVAAPPSRWQQMKGLSGRLASRVRSSALGQWLGAGASRLRQKIGSSKKMLGLAGTLFFGLTAIASAENVFNELVYQGLDGIVGTAATALLLAGPPGWLLGGALMLGGSTISKALADGLVPPARRQEALARQRARPPDPPESSSRTSDEFIAQKTAVEDVDYNVAKKAFGPAQRVTERGLDYYREQADALATRRKDANNSPLDDYRRRAGDLDRQITEYERRVAEYNRRLAIEHARRTAALQAWQAQQRQIQLQRAQQRQQALSNLNRAMQQYWNRPWGASLSPLKMRSPDLTGFSGRSEPFWPVEFYDRN